jgi:hypothetical protein
MTKNVSGLVFKQVTFTGLDISDALIDAGEWCAENDFDVEDIVCTYADNHCFVTIYYREEQS